MIQVSLKQLNEMVEQLPKATRYCRYYRLAVPELRSSVVRLDEKPEAYTTKCVVAKCEEWRDSNGCYGYRWKLLDIEVVV